MAEQWAREEAEEAADPDQANEYEKRGAQQGWRFCLPGAIHAHDMYQQNGQGMMLN